MSDLTLDEIRELQRLHIASSDGLTMRLLDQLERQAEVIAILAETLAKADNASPGKSLDEIDRSLKQRAERCPCSWGDLCSCADDCECRIRDLHQYVEGSGWENWGKIDAK